MSHGNVEQRNGKTDSRDYTVSGGLQMLLLLLPFLFLLFPVLFLLQKAGAVSCLGHGLTYHAGSHLILIIGNHHPVGGQIHIAVLHPAQFSRDTFNRAAAGCAGHAIYMILFRPHIFCSSRTRMCLDF